MSMNGAGIGMAAAITAAAQAPIRLALQAGRTVCYEAVAGTVVPVTAGLRFGTAPPRTATAALSASGSAGQSCNFIGFLPFYLKKMFEVNTELSIATVAPHSEARERRWLCGTHGEQVFFCFFSFGKKRSSAPRSYE